MAEFTVYPGIHATEYNLHSKPTYNNSGDKIHTPMLIWQNVTTRLQDHTILNT